MKVVTILMIEDSMDDIFLMKKALEKSRLMLNLETITDGEEAINHLSTIKEEEYPDMILLDLNLPKVTGIEILKYVKSHEKLKVIPVVVLTSSNSGKDILGSYQNYANSYIRKPINLESFYELANQLKQFWFTLVKLPKDGDSF